MNAFKIKLTDELFAQVVGAVSERTGNVVGQKQVNMIESRLTKRALSLGVRSDIEYLEYFKKNRAKEIEELVSLLTVHHTYFFREFSQFEYMGEHALPLLITKLKAEGRKKIRVWSAACSRGHEAYSLFMYMDQYLKTHAPDFSIEILGTDVDGESVKIATNGVYAWDDIKEISATYLSKYWVRGAGEIAKFAKFKDASRAHCKFKIGNLMETSTYSTYGKFDLIFCRNVFIYFQKDDVNRIASALAEQLYPHGFLFVGLSESLAVAPKSLKKNGPSIYGPEMPKVTSPVPGTPAAETSRALLRVFCVDDSPVILKILKSVLDKESGFEIVATAGNGVEAAKLVQQGLKFDVMTLDIHMPEMTGVEYLEKHYAKNHPPVVMLTSASRDNMDLAQKAMELGAKDYIEKPSLSDLKVRSDEIRSKLRLICQVTANKSTGPSLTKSVSSGSLALEKQFKSSMQVRSYHDKINVLFADDQSWLDLLTVLKDSTFAKSPCVIVGLGDDRETDKLYTRLSTERSLSPKLSRLSASSIKQGLLFANFVDFKKHVSSFVSQNPVCYSVLANLSRQQWEVCPKSTNLKILIGENIDRSVFSAHLLNVTITPATSFAYMASEFFGVIDNKKAA